MIIHRYLTTGVIALLLLGSTSAKAESLADALTYAYEHSGLIEQNRALLRAADEDVAIAVSTTLPIISWVASATNQNPRVPGSDLIQASASISGSLTLYDGGANQFAVEAQKELVLGTREALRDVEQQVLLRAVTAYVNVRSASEFVALRQNNVRVLTEEFRAAQDRFDVGEVTRTDVAQAEAQLAAARSLLAAAEGTFTQAAEEFRAAVGRLPDRPSPVSPAPISRTLDDARAFAVRNHPSILQVQHSVAAAELSIRRGEAAMNPTVSLNARVGVDQNFNTGREIGITATGPIYQGGRLSAQLRQFMAQRDAARAGLHITVQGIEQQVANAFASVNVARASSQASDQQVRAAIVAFRGVREEAALGARTVLDVLAAEQEQLSAQANVIAAQADEVVASYTLLASMGLLTADHLGLQVQQYDPAAYYNLVKDSPAVMSEQGQALDRVLRAIGQ